ncbi:MAG: hypothetical protein PCFJNLEI_01500 [Verrucomicrobiae bacterium]|nr:hypothetical protein [Verrucomicrobiae bacterium]
MKRDMNLIRLLLLLVEGEEPKPDLSGYTQEQQAYHMAKLIEANLVLGDVSRDNNGMAVGAVATELTWQGHEFLDAARNETIWKKVAGKVAKAGVEVGLPVLQQMLTDTLKEHLGMK